jgi:hypothetical protein
MARLDDYLLLAFTLIRLLDVVVASNERQQTHQNPGQLALHRPHLRFFLGRLLMVTGGKAVAFDVPRRRAKARHEKQRLGRRLARSRFGGGIQSWW